MKTDIHSCSGTCPHLRRISRRDFIKTVAVAGAGLLVACSSERQTVALPTNPPFTPTDTPAPTTPPTLTPSPTNMTDSFIAYCGVNCASCPKYKNKTCPGCLSDTCSGCTPCNVRACNRERGIVNCAHCEEYPCQKLEDFYTGWGSAYSSAAKSARAVLDAIHQSLP
jgi:hypothetical protein